MMRFIAVLLQLKIILAQLFDASFAETFFDFSDNLWREIDENCKVKIPVDIKLSKKKALGNHKIYIKLEDFDHLESRRVDQCQRFSQSFLHKARLIDHIHRDWMSLDPAKFFYCEDQCRAYLPNDSMNGFIKIKHIADFCQLSLILVIHHNDFNRMTREEMLERRVNYLTELFSLKEINNSTVEQEVHHLKDYLGLIDNDEEKDHILQICHDLYSRIDESLFSKNIIGNHSVNNVDDYGINKEKLIVIIVCSVGGFVVLFSIGLAIYLTRNRICCKDKESSANKMKRFYI